MTASISKEIYVGYLDVDIDLEDFDTDDLIEELKRRDGSYDMVGAPLEYLQEIHELRRNGRDYQRELDQLIYHTLGRIS